MEKKQIKSKDRVMQHGEVLTPEWLVNDMLNLIPANASRIDSRYLENSCGEGVFLAEVLKRKLELVFKKYINLEDREFYILVALTNIYGLEILKDNVDISRKRLFNVLYEWLEKYNMKKREIFLDSIEHILKINIINMNSLTYEIPLFNGNNFVKENARNIENKYLSKISEWKIDYQTRNLQRIEYIYKDIVREQNDTRLYEQSLKKIQPLQLSFFDLTGESEMFIEEDYIKKAKPIRIFEEVPYQNLINAKIIYKDDERNESIES